MHMASAAPELTSLLMKKLFKKWFWVILRFNPRTLYILGKHSNTELYAQHNQYLTGFSAYKAMKLLGEAVRGACFKIDSISRCRGGVGTKHCNAVDTCLCL